MKKNLLLTAACVLCMLFNLFSQDVFNPTATAPVDNFNGTLPSFGAPHTFKKWIRTPSTALPNPFNTEKFKAYFYSASGGAYDTGMAFRLRYPNNYNPANATKYPVILFMHGIGEAGPVKDNENNLSWGAKEFEGKIDSGLFNAFLLFPQTVFGDWALNYSNINATLDALQQYCNADPDRIITMGLSLGGDGTMKYSFAYPQRSAISIAASPGSIGDFTQDPTPFIHVPFWIASGGDDPQFANPQRVGAFINLISSNGGNARWTFYPNRGHGTWPYMWDEPYLIPYWQTAHKANPLVFGLQTDFPANTAFNVKIGITPNFAQYQWQKDGIDLAPATNDINVSVPGTYRVRFRRTAGGVWSNWSPNPAVITQQAPSDNVPPSAPGNLHMLSTTTTAVSLDWDNSTDNVGVTGYDVYVNGVKKYSVTNSDVIVANLNPSTAYSFTVQARDAANNFSAFSSALNITTATPPDTVSPTVPANVQVTGSTTTSITLDWDNSTDNVGVTGYDIFVNGVKKYSNTTSDIVATGLTASTTYAFTIQARDAANNFSAFSTAVNGTTTTAPDIISPSAPANVQVTGATTTSITLDWDNSTDNVGVTGYDIFVNGVKKYSNTTSDIVATGLTAATTYSFTVQAHDAANNFSAFSAAVNGTTGSITPPVDATPPSTPGNLNVLSSTTTTISLDWDNSTDNVGVTGYDIFVNGVMKYSSVSSDLVANNLVAGTTYSFTVQAHDAAGNFSAFSSAVNGTTATVSTGGALSYKFYQGSFSVLPNFSTLSPVKTGTTPNVDINVRTAGVNDNFAFLWEGYIVIPASGTYTFETVSDDGSKLYFNTTYSAAAAALVNNDGLHPAISATGSVTIAAGTYPIAITYYEATGGESMQVYWTGPGITRQLIPNAAFTDTGIPPSTSAGLTYKYYEGAFTTLPNFSALTPVKTGISPNADISVRTAGVNDNFAFVWEGYINITTPGTYTFETISDDGSKFYFNSLYSAGATALVSNDGLHAPTSATGTVVIPAAGNYPVAMTFFEATGGETMQVYWSGPGIARQIIPNTVFSTGTVPPVATNGLNYKYYQGAFTSLPNFTSLTPVKTGTSLNTDITVRTPGVNDNFAFLWEGFITLPAAGQYTFETVSDDGSKLYFNTAYSAAASALVNNDGLHAASSATGVITMAVGTYPIAISFFEATGGESMQVYWSGPGIVRQLIPNSAFTTSGITPPASTAGLNYKYFEGSYTTLPNFNVLNPVKTGTSANADITVRNQGVNDNFAFVWEGYIHIPTAGTYTFETISDDGSKLYFNSLYVPGATALVTNDGLHAPVSATGSVTVAAGIYPIAITFFEATGGETMQVYWSGPGIARQLIPNSAFTTTSAADGEIVMSQQNMSGMPPVVDGSANIIIKQLYPNPFSEGFMINFYSPSSDSRISVDILDVAGRSLYKQDFGNIATGNTTLKVNAGGKVSVPGVYFVRLMANGVPMKVVKMVKK